MNKKNYCPLGLCKICSFFATYDKLWTFNFEQPAKLCISCHPFNKAGVEYGNSKFVVPVNFLKKDIWHF
jgi:hypothetical protein